jgi:hypothetical protein
MTFEIFIVGVLRVVAMYAEFGALFGLWFVSGGVARVDAQAQGAGWGFRALIFPGVVALWPLFVSRLAHGITEPPLERNPHR